MMTVPVVEEPLAHASPRRRRRISIPAALGAGIFRTRHGLAYLFISHDVSTVATFADELAVMYRGEIVERGPTDEVLNRPQHPYTKVLVSSVPQLHTGWLETAIDSRDEVLKQARHVELAD